MKTFDELWRDIKSAIGGCENLSDLNRIKVAVLGKNGIFKQIEDVLWK